MTMPIQTTTIRLPSRHLDPALELVLARVRLRARRRLAWLRTGWAQAGADTGANDAVPAQVRADLEDWDAPQREAAWYASDEVAVWNDELADIEQALAEEGSSRFSLLHRIFDLDATDSDILQLSLALALDPSLARLYADLQQHATRGYATEYLAARLFEYGRSLVWNPQSSLRRWRLIHEEAIALGEPLSLVCNRTVRSWLLEEDTLDEHLVGLAAAVQLRTPLETWPVDSTVELINGNLDGTRYTPMRVVIAGVPGSGRRTLAGIVSSQLGLPALTVDSDRVDDQNWTEVFILAHRHAYLNRSALVWSGDACLRNPWPRTVAHFPVQFVVCERDQELQPLPDVTDFRIDMPDLSLDERRSLWQQHIPEATTWPTRAFETLVTQHRVTIGEVGAVARMGVASPEQAATAVRELHRHQLGNLARPLETPFRWDDLVVDDSLRLMLEDFVFEAQERASLWEDPHARRLFPQGRGLFALLAGPPGTGKTMSAQCVAANLELNLFRIDLSSVVSKYVGETSQNLERILSRAERMNVVLLFDEADALFGKRTEIKDAHDRFANIDTNYLLQAIENHNGIALLATNKKGNLDPAFIRRIRYVLEFAQPNSAQRLRIWRQIVGELVGAERLATLAEPLELIANRVEVNGGQIKYAILTGIFTARQQGEPLGVRHLIRGLDRELRKEGRALGDHERRRMLDRER